MSETILVGGEWIKPTSTDRFEQRNPVDLNEVTDTWPLAGEADTIAAIEAAEQAYASWRRMPPVKRADLFKGVLERIDRRREEIARMITIENGKTIKESRSEVQSGYREMEYQIGQGLRMEGRTVPSINEGVLTYSVRTPLGPVAIITPWNFPFNVPVRKITPALMAGNTCILKPASLTPGVGKLFAELFEEFPPGVINFITGSGSVAGKILSTDARIKAISFTGSTDVGRRIHETAARSLIPTQLEMGGKNPVVVLADADLEAASAGIVTSAYTCAGQWCTSTSRVIVETAVADELSDRIVDGVRALRVGNGLVEGHTMGPVCGSEQLETILGYIDIGRSEGAKILAGGSQMTGRDEKDGCFIEPTVFGGVTPEMRIAREEIFGPALSILSVKDLEEAISVANDVEFGLTSSIFTKDLERAFSFVEETEVGFTHVNLMSGYREPAHSFGGIKASGHDVPESGETGIEFFTEHKVVYVKYGG